MTPDGIVGQQTMGKAMALGMMVMKDDDESESGVNFPLPPNGMKPLVSNADREKVFGKFSYVSSPIAGMPEAIRITDGWTKNIIQVPIPQLRGIVGSPGSCSVPFHTLAAKQLQDLWADWEFQGLLPLVLTWAGSWVPRFVRGSTVYLSNHAFGSAFDINPAMNKLGTCPALVGELGSTRKLVATANAHGFYWGGHFGNLDGSTKFRGVDGMHFEIAEIR